MRYYHPHPSSSSFTGSIPIPFAPFSFSLPSITRFGEPFRVVVVNDFGVDPVAVPPSSIPDRKEGDIGNTLFLVLELGDAGFNGGG